MLFQWASSFSARYDRIIAPLSSIFFALVSPSTPMQTGNFRTAHFLRYIILCSDRVIRSLFPRVSPRTRWRLKHGHNWSPQKNSTVIQASSVRKRHSSVSFFCRRTPEFWLRNWRQFFCCFRFLTNVTVSGTLFGIGDALQQNIEIHVKKEKNAYDWARTGEMFKRTWDIYTWSIYWTTLLDK